MKPITSLAEIASKYQVFLVDLWGVVHDGINLYSGVQAALEALYKQDKTVIFLSNAPRPSLAIAAKLRHMGLKLPFYNIITSGDYTRHILQTEYARGKIYHLGAYCNKDILADISNNIVDLIETCDVVVLTAFIEATDPLDLHDPTLKEIVHAGKPVLCANPDLVAMHGEGIRYTSGTFAQRLEKMGGMVRYLGKPTPAFYQYAIDCHGLGYVNKQRTLMIGDTYATDITGAVNYGIDSLLVRSTTTAYGMDTNLSTYICNGIGTG